MDSHASARIKSRLSCLRDGLNIFSNDTFFPPTDVRLRLQNLQLSSTLAFFCCLPRFFSKFTHKSLALGMTVRQITGSVRLLHILHGLGHTASVATVYKHDTALAIASSRRQDTVLPRNTLTKTAVNRGFTAV